MAMTIFGDKPTRVDKHSQMYRRYLAFLDSVVKELHRRLQEEHKNITRQ